MKNIFSATLFGLILSSCGGGSSTNNLTLSSNNDLEGRWLSDCIDGRKGLTTFNGRSIQTEVLNYPTVNCGGSVVGTEIFNGTFEIVGETITSVCIADKINVNYENRPAFYTIFCVYQGNLYEGDATTPNDGFSSSTRPDQIDFSFKYTKLE